MPRLRSARCARPAGWLLLGLLALAVEPTHSAADVTVQASVSNQRVRVGETTTLVIAVEGSQAVAAPALGPVDGFNVRYVGPSQQVSIVNGAMSARIQHRYALTALSEGQFSIGPFEVEHEGQVLRTSPVSVVVSAAATGAQQIDPQAQPGGSNLRLLLQVDRERVYLHERVAVDVVLYVGAVSARDLQYPTLAAESVSVEDFGQPVRSAEVIDGQRFEVLRFRTTVIPLKAGRLSLGPARTSLNVVQRPRNFFFTQRQPVELTSNALALDVLSLPAQGKPADFSGAVGRFSIEVTAAPLEVQAGDPITVRIALRGDGNLAQLRPPSYPEGAGFKVYEPQVTDDSQESLRVYEQVVIPESDQIERLPPLRFSFFDPDRERYETIDSGPVPVGGRPAGGEPQRGIVRAGGTAKRRDPETLGRDIVFIKDVPDALMTAEQRRSRWWALLFWQPVPFLLYAALVVYDRRRRRLSGDERYARATRARGDARRALARVEACRDDAEFFDGLAAAVREYLGAKLGLPPGAIERERLQAAGMGEAAIAKVDEVLEACAQARFARAASAADRRHLLELARTLVRDVERDRNLRVV